MTQLLPLSSLVMLLVDVLLLLLRLLSSKPLLLLLQLLVCAAACIASSVDIGVPLHILGCCLIVRASPKEYACWWYCCYLWCRGCFGITMLLFWEAVCIQLSVKPRNL